MAMNKRNAEAAAAEAKAAEESGVGSGSGSSGQAGDDNGSGAIRSGADALHELNSSGGDLPLLPGSEAGSKSLSNLLHPSGSGSPSERMRNPFADDEDDDVDVDDEEDDDDEEVGLNGGSDVGRVGLGWNRGSWWRSMVGGDRGKTSRSNSGGDGGNNSSFGGTFAREKFGDGRDSSSDSSGNGNSSEEEGNDHGGKANKEEDDEDEEFGDFAMPEVSASGNGDSASASANASASGSGPTVAGVGGGLFFDRIGDRETVLFKPLALHPSAPSSTTAVDNTHSSATGSLWPFERLGFLGSGGKDESKANEGGEAGGVDKPMTAFPANDDDDDELEVVGEDGHKVARVVEAKRRTSLEDPDEEDEVVL